MASLPKDIVIEILSRLPVKCLIRVRLVCKIWYDLLKSLNFISKHVKNYNVNHTHLVVQANSDRNCYMFLDEMLENNLSYQNLRDALSMDHLHFMGSSDGLFCLLRRSTRFLLWNPATKEIRTLPRCRPPHILSPEVGFGFNHIKNDFELVLIGQFDYELSDEENDYAVKRLYEYVGVYTLSTNSWREFETDEITDYDRLGDFVHINGFCYWVGHTGLELNKMILSFDMSGDKFQEIQPPRPRTTNFDFNSGSSPFLMGLFNDALALLLSDNMENCFQLWVLMKIDDGNCWNQTLNVVIEPFQVWGPNGFWKNDGFVFHSKKGQLLLYDVATQETKDLGLHTHASGRAYSYKESLINVMINLSNDFDIPWHILGVS